MADAVKSIIPNMDKHCSKAKFPNEAVAQTYINKLQATSTRAKIPKSAYLCPFCLCWHLTSQDNREEIVKLKEKVGMLKVLIKQKDGEIANKKKTIKKLQDWVFNLKNKK